MLDNKNFILRHRNNEIAALEKKLEKETKRYHRKIRRRHTSCWFWGNFFIMVPLYTAPIILSECRFFYQDAISCLILLAGILFGIWNFKRMSRWRMKAMLPANEKILFLFDEIEKQKKEYFGAPENTTRLTFLAPDNAPKNKKSNKTIYKTDCFDAFVRNGMLYLWSNADLCGFPISAIKSIAIVKRPLTYENNSLFQIPEESVAKKYNIQSKIVDGSIQHSTMPSYASMRIYHKEKHYEILFPIFELKQVLKLLNLKQHKKRKYEFPNQTANHQIKFS